ncbi:MAG: hypothetical protein AAF197_00610 [Pseudomonadota bacterium]
MATQKSKLHVASRVFAATIPAYLLTNTIGVLLTFVLVTEKTTGVALATIMSFAIYTAIIIWIFSVDKLKTVWWGLTLAILFTGGVDWWLVSSEQGL